jgi:hypothetical protein
MAVGIIHLVKVMDDGPLGPPSTAPLALAAALEPAGAQEHHEFRA